MNVYVDEDGSVTCDNKQVLDLFHDIGAGICNAQKLAEAKKENSSFDLSKVKTYQPKTRLPYLLQDILNQSNYRQAYEWQHGKEFIRDGTHFKVVRYDINTSDWCIVQMDGKEVKMTKKNLRRKWEGKGEE